MDKRAIINSLNKKNKNEVLQKWIRVVKLLLVSKNEKKDWGAINQIVVSMKD